MYQRHLRGSDSKLYYQNGSKLRCSQQTYRPCGQNSDTVKTKHSIILNEAVDRPWDLDPSSSLEPGAQGQDTSTI